MSSRRGPWGGLDDYMYCGTDSRVKRGIGSCTSTSLCSTHLRAQTQCKRKDPMFACKPRLTSLKTARLCSTCYYRIPLHSAPLRQRNTAQILRLFVGYCVIRSTRLRNAPIALGIDLRNRIRPIACKIPSRPNHPGRLPPSGCDYLAESGVCSPRVPGRDRRSGLSFGGL